MTPRIALTAAGVALLDGPRAECDGAAAVRVDPCGTPRDRPEQTA